MIPYVILLGKIFDEIIQEMGIDMSKICKWFHHNGFKADPVKFHFLIRLLVDRSVIVLGSTTKARN